MTATRILACIFLLGLTVPTPVTAQSHWVDQLQNQKQQVCCYDNDGRRLDDPEWRISGDGYEVLFTEGWIAVPEDALVTGRNRDGIARVWSTLGPEGRVIRCFLKGSES